eukprot:TRINITY_DN74061_c0_g2_i3.p1 TRINITY_DN74061_c0_g2~~TRINITY_DN74061_c0_g2_i3.p1  ORF type:complete len:447 (+),score=64.02 TRINITY_DN74061_c0_g2_i3:122-1342(+)
MASAHRLAQLIRYGVSIPRLSTIHGKPKVYITVKRATKAQCTLVLEAQRERETYWKSFKYCTSGSTPRQPAHQKDDMYLIEMIIVGATRTFAAATLCWNTNPSPKDYSRLKAMKQFSDLPVRLIWTSAVFVLELSVMMGGFSFVRKANNNCVMELFITAQPQYFRKASPSKPLAKFTPILANKQTKDLDVISVANNDWYRSWLQYLNIHQHVRVHKLDRYDVFQQHGGIVPLHDFYHSSMTTPHSQRPSGRLNYRAIETASIIVIHSDPFVLDMLKTILISDCSCHNVEFFQSYQATEIIHLMKGKNEVDVLCYDMPFVQIFGECMRMRPKSIRASVGYCINNCQRILFRASDTSDTFDDIKFHDCPALSPDTSIIQPFTSWQIRVAISLGLAVKYNTFFGKTVPS